MTPARTLTREMIADWVSNIDDYGYENWIPSKDAFLEACDLALSALAAAQPQGALIVGWRCGNVETPDQELANNWRRHGNLVMPVYKPAAVPPSQEAVAEVTYSNWNGITIAALPRGDELRLPVGTPLYASPAPAEGMEGYCRECESLQPMSFRHCIEANEGKRPFTDVCCDTCHFIAVCLIGHVSPAAPAQPGQEKEPQVQDGDGNGEAAKATIPAAPAWCDGCSPDNCFGPPGCKPPLAQDGREALNGAHGYAGAKQAFLNSANVEYLAPAASLTPSERPGAAGFLREALDFLKGDLDFERRIGETYKDAEGRCRFDIITRIRAHLAAEGQT